MLEWACQTGIHCVDMGRSQWHQETTTKHCGVLNPTALLSTLFAQGTSILDLDLKMERVPFYRLARWGGSTCLCLCRSN